MICIIYTLDGEGLTFVLDRFDPGGGGTISCSGLTPGDISVPFEVRLTKVFHYPTDKLIYHMYIHVCLLMFILLFTNPHLNCFSFYLNRCLETQKKTVMVHKLIISMLSR